MPRLDLSPIVHGLIHFFFLSLLVLLLKGDKADFFHLAVLSQRLQVTHRQWTRARLRVAMFSIGDVRQRLIRT